MDLLDDATVTAGLVGLAWDRVGDTLVRTIVLRDFVAAIDLVNRVAAIAEAAGHHPDIQIRWNTVLLTLTTHSAGGLTRADLDLASDIDRIQP